ncbi:MAG: hypothetical protein VYA60_09375 [Pseudomonadota bacterium]|nr:hypothetical protein [Pseudomonadota bacterium]
MAGFHHGISAQEVTQGILPMRNANVSVLGLIVTSTDADDTMYPVSTPVLLTGITQDNIDKAGTDGTLRDCLQTIRDIHNPTVVVLRVPKSFEADSLDVLLTCPARFGLMPKRFGAPELDTPDVVLKLISIAKHRRGMVYASPRNADGTLITDKAAIVAYRDTYGDRELCIIDGEWGVPGKSQPSDGSGGGSNTLEMSFLKLRSEIIEEAQGVTAGIVYKINDGLFRTALLSDGSHSTMSVFGAGSNSGLIDHFLSYEPDLLDFGGVFVPMPLDQNASYLFGMNNTLFAEFATASGFTGFDGIDDETVLTLYPASALPPANIDYDVFDLIIDPASYTQADLQYFADRGVTPATKNPDGSYTLKSQLTLPPFEQPPL